jgi:hypothetical protein
MAAKTRTLSNLLLNAALTNATYTGAVTVYTALNTSTSTATAPGTEDVDTTYARIATTFSTSTLGTTSNTGALAFYGVGGRTGNITPSAAIVEAAIYDHLTASGTAHELYFGTLAVPKTVSVGDTLSFAIGALSVSET